MLIIYDLDIMNGTAVGVNTPLNSDGLELRDIPHEHHPVAVQSNGTLVDIIDDTGDYIGKFIGFILLNFDS